MLLSVPNVVWIIRRCVIVIWAAQYMRTPYMATQGVIFVFAAAFVVGRLVDILSHVDMPLVQL